MITNNTLSPTRVKYGDCDCQYLKSVGFKIISRRYGIISRIDRADWDTFLADNEYPVDADIYRRLFSTDKYQISSQLNKKNIFEQSSVEFENDKYIPDEYKYKRMKK